MVRCSNVGCARQVDDPPGHIFVSLLQLLQEVSPWKNGIVTSETRLDQMSGNLLCLVDVRTSYAPVSNITPYYP